MTIDIAIGVIVGGVVLYFLKYLWENVIDRRQLWIESIIYIIASCLVFGVVYLCRFMFDFIVRIVGS